MTPPTDRNLQSIWSSLLFSSFYAQMSILWDMEFFSSVAAIWKFNFVMSLAFCCEFSRWIEAQQHRWNPNVQGCGQLTAVKRKTTLQEAKGVNWVNILEQLDSSRPAQGLCRFCFFCTVATHNLVKATPQLPPPPSKRKKNLNRSLFSIRSYETEPVRFSISMSLGRKKGKVSLALNPTLEPMLPTHWCRFSIWLGGIRLCVFLCFQH